MSASLPLGELRALCAQDAPWLAMLHSEEFDPSWSQASFNDLLHLSTTHAWGSSENRPGMILACLIDGEAEILTFMIANQARGMGLGDRLLSHALTQLHNAGATRVFLDVAERRQAALNLYQKHGFVLNGRRKGYYRGPKGREDALTMVLTTGEHRCDVEDSYAG